MSQMLSVVENNVKYLMILKILINSPYQILWFLSNFTNTFVIVTELRAFLSCCVTNELRENADCNLSINMTHERGMYYNSPR